MNIKKRIFVSMIALAIMCCVTILVFFAVRFYTVTNDNMNRKVRVAANVLEQTVSNMRESVYIAALSMPHNPDLVTAVLTNDRETIAATAEDLVTVARLDFATVLDREANVFVRTHDPNSYGDSNAHLPHVKSALGGNIEVQFIGSGTRLPLVISAASPIFGEDMEVIGAITFGLRLDNQDLVHHLQELTGCEVSFFAGSERVATTIRDAYGNYYFGMDISDSLIEQVLSGEIYFGRRQIVGRDIITAYLPIFATDEGGEVVGMMFAGLYTEEDLRTLYTSLLYGLGITLLLILASVIIAYFISGTIQRRLDNMMKQLREMDEYTQLMLDAMPMSCVLWNKELKAVNCNKEALRFFDEKSLYSLDVLKILPEFQPNGERSYEIAQKLIKGIFETGFGITELDHVSPAGEVIPCELTQVRVRLRGVDYVVVFYRDLREQKAMEQHLRKARDEAEAASKAKTAFLATMSHEIRTPMNSIVGFSELAMDGDIPEKTRDYLVKIMDNSKLLLQIINDVLDISKIESGKMELENVPFDLREMFVSCRMTIMPKTIEKNLQLHFYAEPSVDKIPLGDPIKLRQILLNLLTNAVKFTNSGMIKLLADVKERGENHVTMRFEVTDSGMGMTPEQIERIFDSFTQAETGTTRKYGGTGLGLAITKSMVELMGGTLEVESTPRLGSKFSFEITFETIDTDKSSLPTQIVVHDDMKKPTFEGEILLFEDNHMNQQVVCEHLTRVGLKTVIAENGKIGVDILQSRLQKNEKPFDLIFMDIHMPEMDGLEATELILEMGVKTPIIAMTANIMSHDIELYKQKGMKSHVSKPFTSQELWTCLTKYLTPVKWQSEDDAQSAKAEKELRQKLINRFVNGNRNWYSDFMEALQASDIKLAHRMAHTLKSNAGQLGKILLQRAAEDVEKQLETDKNLATKQQMETLGTELGAALTELAPLVSEMEHQPTAALDSKATHELLTKLEAMLEDDDSECLQQTDNIRSIPGSEALIRHMENLDFASALKALAELKKKG